MANDKAKASPAQAETTTEAALSERGDAERELVEEQAAAAETAEERRTRQAERAQELKSVPDGAQAPTEKSTRGGDTTFARSRFLDPVEGPALTGHPHHVIVGALHLDDQEYQSVEDVQKKIETWIGTEVGVPADGSDQG